ncbi:MAG: GlxA family transcriptional regulator [Pseudomonadota bacterium]
MNQLAVFENEVERPANVDCRSIVFFLVQDFSMIAFATAVEPLRIANRMLGREFYSWRLASMDGQPVTASNGVEVAVETSLKQERDSLASSRRPSNMFLCSGINVEESINKSLFAYIRENKNSGVVVGGLCTAAFLLAAAGLLKGKRCAIHWENLPGFAEHFPDVDVYADLYEMDGNTWTCAGGTAALDMMLSMIENDLGEDLVNRVCEQALTDRVRNPNDRQRLPLRARLGVQNAKVLSIIEYMEANIAEPLQLIEIADFVGLSRRQIERLFQQHMGRSPARYYLEIRLDRARHLLMQSTMPVVDVAIACGFVSASHFSKCYREMYGKSPLQERT